jgi:hypothetical protein
MASLRGAENVASQWAMIDEWAEEGDVERLRDAAQALVEPTPAAVPDWAAEAVFDHIARVLALTPLPGFAFGAREIARAGDARELAALTASGQPVDVCAELVGSGAAEDEEFSSCLIQELVLRVEHLDRAPFVDFWRGIQSHGHPLGWLPLRLTSIEASILLPSYSSDGMAYETPGRREDAVSDGTTAEVAPLAAETTTPLDGQRIASAVASWLEESNGRMEARIFTLRPGELRPLDAVLADAGLECLVRGGPMRIDSIAPADAFGILFSAASTGGAYDHGHRGAYGRLNAWRTVGALAGAQPDAAIEQAAELVEQARWFSFESNARWFYSVAWDIGLVALGADGTRLAVLAATDTD